MYCFNACSLLPKFDELTALSCLLKPHTIAIVETWLSQDILGSEIDLPSYNYLD